MFEDFHQTTIGELLAAQAGRYPDHVYLQLGDQRWTYRDVHEQASALAHGLMRLGLKQGDRLAVILPNIPQFVIALYGAARAGLILAPVNVRRSETEVLTRLARTRAAALLAGGYDGAQSFKKVEALRGQLPDLKHVITLDSGLDGGIAWQEVLAGSPGLALPAPAPHDPALIVHTLGNAGEPRGAQLTHGGIVHNAADLADCLGAGPEDALLGSVPFSNTFGLTANILACAVAGARLVCVPAYHPARAQELIAGEKVTIHSGVPTMFALELNQADFDSRAYSSIRVGIMAGAPCPPELVARVKEKMGFSVLIGYGLTEASPAVTMTRLDDGPITATQTVGHPLDDIEIKVVDPEGNSLPHGSEGELCVRGYNVMLGYWDDPAATAEVLDIDGWLHTGDLAVIDPDGPVRIVGRKGESIIRAGYKIHPGAIELALRMHPAVKECAVVGAPDLIFGELIVACVIRKGETAVTAEELSAFAASRLPDFALPDRFLFFDILPRRSSGVVHKEYLRERVRIRGHAWKFGKNIDTDAIIPARRCNTADPRELALYCMEDADPGFVHKMRRGDLIVADTNFGCGSSREVAPLTIKAAGLSAVIAKSFARIFFRNAINIGLPILECPAAVDGIRETDEIEVEPAAGIIRNLTTGETYQAEPFPDFLQRIIERGGLLAYVEERLAAQKADAAQ